MKNQCVVKRSLGTVQPKLTLARFVNTVGNVQDHKGLSLRDIKKMAFPLSDASKIKDSDLKITLKKATGQGFLDLVGTNYVVKGHAKKAGGSKKAKSKRRSKSAGKKASKGKSKSAGKTKAKKKASKGRKKSAGGKKKTRKSSKRKPKEKPNPEAENRMFS